MSKSKDIPKLDLLSADSVEETMEKTFDIPQADDKTKKSGSSKPATVSLVCQAIKTQNEKKGSSVQGIKKFIEAERGIQLSSAVLKKAFTKGMKDGLLIRMDSSETASLTGRYKLSKAPPAKAKKPAKEKVNKENDQTNEGEPVKVKKTKPTAKALSPTQEKKDKPKAKKTAPKEPSPAKAAQKKAPKKEAAAKKPSAPKSKASVKQSKGSTSDTEVQSKAAKPKAAAAPRRRSKSESHATEEEAGPSKKARGNKGPSKSKATAGKRSPRV